MCGDIGCGVFGTYEGAFIWLNSEPCGVFCGLMSWAFLAYGMGATTFSVIVPWLGYSVIGCLNILLFNALSLFAMYCHFKAMTTDPGAVPKNAMPCLDDDAEMDYEAVGERSTKYKKFCKRCKAFKPVRAHHCSICARCIIKMDHHCPWVNNCVGIGNQKLFLLFVGWTSVVCGYAIILIVMKFVICSMENRTCGNEDHMLYVLGLFVESMLFGLFTLCMLGDQLSALQSNQTSIDKLKNQKHEVKVEINEVCGTPMEMRFNLLWFIPIPVSFSEMVREKVLGYRLDYSAVGQKEELTPLTSASANAMDGSESRESEPAGHKHAGANASGNGNNAVGSSSSSNNSTGQGLEMTMSMSSGGTLSKRPGGGGEEESISETVLDNNTGFVKTSEIHLDSHGTVHSHNNNNNGNIRKRAGPP